MDEYDLLHQIGRGNVMAISGGRFDTLTNDDGEVTDLILPVAYGYRVRINLEVNDTYTVRREFVRGGKVYEKGRQEGVHCDEVANVAYRASCYVNVEFGQVA
jgi:hypothetical protein